MTYLPDVNVWIALAADKHIHHPLARSWFAGLREEKLWFCRLTQLGFLRLLTNKQVMQDEVVSPEGAWQAYNSMRADRRIGYLAEPSGLTETWDMPAAGRLGSSNVWTDAYLCAFAQAAGLTLVTFDRRIHAAGGLDCLVLDANL